MRVPLYMPMRPDTVWSADFMSDALADGRRFGLFNVVDEFNREALHIEGDTSITSARLVRLFEELRAQHWPAAHGQAAVSTPRARFPL